MKKKTLSHMLLSNIHLKLIILGLVLLIAANLFDLTLLKVNSGPTVDRRICFV